MAWARRLALLWLACLALAAGAAEPVPLPVLQDRVTDLTATLDSMERGRLEASLAAIERSHRAQVAVLLLPTTGPETIEQFGIRLAEAWKIGRQGADDGLIVIVAKDDRRVRIEVGYGLEGVIPDAVAKRIIEEQMLPYFRKGEFYNGLRAAISWLDHSLAAQAPVPATAAKPGSAGASFQTDGMTWLFLLAAGAGILRAIFGLLGSMAAAAVAGVAAFMIMGSLSWAILAAIAVFVLSFFNIGFGDGSSSGRSSSGGGGFSGGGGSFGGGGASGRW